MGPFFFMKLKVSYEKWENHFSQARPVFAPAVSGDATLRSAPWLRPVIHCSFLALETGAVCLSVITSAGSLEDCTLQILVYILIRPWCQLRRNATKHQYISGSPNKSHCFSQEYCNTPFPGLASISLLLALGPNWCLRRR